MSEEQIREIIKSLIKDLDAQKRNLLGAALLSTGLLACGPKTLYAGPSVEPPPQQVADPGPIAEYMAPDPKLQPPEPVELYGVPMPVKPTEKKPDPRFAPPPPLTPPPESEAKPLYSAPSPLPLPPPEGEAKPLYAAPDLPPAPVPLYDAPLD